MQPQLGAEDRRVELWLWLGVGGTVAASEHIRAATALRDLPALTAALASGSITWSKVRSITRVHASTGG